MKIEAKLLIIVFCVVVCNQLAFPQNNKVPPIGNWTMFFGQLRFHDKWSIHGEGQARDYGVFAEPEQILLRTGINFHYGSNVLFTGGYGHITNYSYDDEIIQSPMLLENRAWEQFQMRNSIGRFFFEHRYRLEQRWMQTNNSNWYLSRARYLLRITVPLNKKEVEKNTMFLSFYDEVFIHLNSSTFDRNRLFGAIGYQFLPTANFQFGYLAQTVNITTKHYLQLAVNYSIDIRKKE